MIELVNEGRKSKDYKSTDYAQIIHSSTKKKAKTPAFDTSMQALIMMDTGTIVMQSYSNKMWLML